MIGRAILMVQKEFAQRMLAGPGSKVYGRLSVMVQQQAEGEILFHVGPGAFHPRPSVTSTVLRLRPRLTPLAPVRDPAQFAQVVKQAFAAPPEDAAAGAGAVGRQRGRGPRAGQAGIEGTRRAEELSVAEFARLADAFMVLSATRGRESSNARVARSRDRCAHATTALAGRHRAAVWTSGKGLRLARPVDSGSLARLSVAARITAVRRKGKYILIDLGRGQAGILVHLGMTGRLRLQAASEPRAPHTHVVWSLAGGDELRFVDPRRFGWVAASQNVDALPEVAGLGPDALAELDVASAARLAGGVGRAAQVLSA